MAENQGYRAAGQAGFRDGKCTNNHVFDLNNRVDRCQNFERFTLVLLILGRHTSLSVGIC